MVNKMEVCQFNNVLPSPKPFLFPSYICYHMISYSSSLFVSISILILVYNIDMTRHVNVHFHVWWLGQVLIKKKRKAFHEKAHVIVFFPNNYLIFPP
jgi:hypothetical protein